MNIVNKTNNPKIRFLSFLGNWETFGINECMQRVGESVNVNPDELYREIGVRSHAKGIFHKEPVYGVTLGNKRVFHVHVPAFVVNIVFAWEHAIAITDGKEEGFIASHRFPMFIPKESKVDINFIKYFFTRKYGKYLLGLASPGGAGRNKTLGQKDFLNLKINIPSLEEQQKIVAFLTVVDTKITQLEQKKNLLQEYKQGMMQQLFSQQIRFKDDQGNEYSDWEKLRLSEVLDYKQPTKYLVNNTEYNDQYEIPVLTAGKTFLLGYTNEKTGVFKNTLPVIIFDDFTTAFKFVCFPFKAKSSAMKILIPRDNSVNIRFVYEAMKRIKFPLGEHKRYWISEYQKEKILYPSKPEQQKIANFLSAIDQKINLVAQQVEQAKTFKKGLLQQMFV